MKNQIVLNKEPHLLYGIALQRLNDLQESYPAAKKDYFIPISKVREKLGRNFSMKKRDIMELLYFLHDMGFIDICCKGIKLNFKIKCGNKIK